MKCIYDSACPRYYCLFSEAKSYTDLWMCCKNLDFKQYIPYFQPEISINFRIKKKLILNYNCLLI